MIRETPNGKVTTTEVKGSYQLNNNRATRIEVESTIVTPKAEIHDTNIELLATMFKGIGNAYINN